MGIFLFFRYPDQSPDLLRLATERLPMRFATLSQAHIVAQPSFILTACALHVARDSERQFATSLDPPNERREIAEERGISLIGFAAGKSGVSRAESSRVSDPGQCSGRCKRQIGEVVQHEGVCLQPRRSFELETSGSLAGKELFHPPSHSWIRFGCCRRNEG